MPLPSIALPEKRSTKAMISCVMPLTPPETSFNPSEVFNWSRHDGARKARKPKAKIKPESAQTKTANPFFKTAFWTECS